MEHVDYYDELGLARSATAEEIRSAFRRLARRYHPDVNKDPGAQARFQRINEAHEVLCDPERRRQYDAGGRSAAGGTFTGAAVAEILRRFAYFQQQRFGATRKKFGGRPAETPVGTRGADLEVALRISGRQSRTGHQFTIQVYGRPVVVAVPAGVQTGQVLRIHGYGAPAVAGGVPGDLCLVCEVVEEMAA